jgi:glucose/arabinose dehydrogenase
MVDPPTTMTPRWLIGLGSLLLALLNGTAAAAELQPLLSGLANPLYVTDARDGSGRIFVVEQGGTIKGLAPEASAPTVFLDIADRVLAGGEQGLLGLAFHPQYAANGRLFVDYTRKPDGATVVAEYQRSADPNVALRSERILLTIDQPFPNHNGGMIEFGPDGYLYIGMGDGGSGDDPGNRAQNVDELLGKILRIDVDTRASGLPYGIPADNPFAGTMAGRGEIYAIGLRNPYRFSFDRATGQLIVGDVGQDHWEEIDHVTRGANLGWRVFEGDHCTGLDPLCGISGFTGPIAEYGHTGGRCAVTGGYVYRGNRGTLPAGTYVFADFCTGEILALNGEALTLLIASNLSISSFGEDQDGELYVVNLGGTVHRLAPSSPVAAVLPSSRSVTVGVPATAFATIINTNDATAPGCGLSLVTPLPARFAYQATDAATNALTGTPNTPIDIPAGARQSFVFAITPGSAVAPTDVVLGFRCANGVAAPLIPGVNTLQLSADTGRVPDIVALSATLANDGIVNIPADTGTGVFSVATVNVGASGSIVATADTGSAALPVAVVLCETLPATGQCVSPIGPSVTTPIAAGSTPTFAVFVGGSDRVPFSPAVNRIFVRLVDAVTGVTRGSTSVAVRTQ